MSLPAYPPSRYDGEHGHSRTHLRRADQPADITYPNGVKVTYLARGTETYGDFGLYRWDFSPEPSGPGPHFHRGLSESFFVLDGNIRLYSGDRWVDGGAGDFLHVPPGGMHGFRNESGEPASMLLLFAPGAPREEYFETLLKLREGSLEITESERDAFGIRHDNWD
ncbi:cupin domain-containing protein [Micromonospora sp. NPDC049523]|uniref:cupin domain-containing protein n=1 Tax=Micromonospora sp. NPDC049523 TaxID=3155921 RepID=UPI00343FCB5A